MRISIGFGTAIASLAAGLALTSAAGAQEATYSQLVAKANADLKAGDTALALTESQKATGMAPSQWEAYVVEAGALQILHDYEASEVAFKQALAFAPQNKKAAVQVLLEKCRQEQLAKSGSGAPAVAETDRGVPAATPNYSETVKYIQQYFVESTAPDDNFSAPDAQVFDRTRYASAISFDGCKTVTIKMSSQSSGTNRGVPTAMGQATTLYLPIQSTTIDGIEAGDGIVVMDHSGSGKWAMDASWSGQGDNFSMGSTKGGDGNLHFYSVLSDKNFPDWIGDDFIRQINGPAVGLLIKFKRPGSSDVIPHLQRAFAHLQEICKNHPEQAVPSSPF